MSYLSTAATPVPVTHFTGIDMNGFRVAIGSNAATAGDAAQIFGKIPLADAGHLDVGGLAGRVPGMRTAAGAAIVLQIGRAHV